MATLLSYFPFGTWRGTLFAYGLGAFYAFLNSFGTIILMILNRGDYFRTNSRVEKPRALTDDKLGKHESVKLKNGLTIHYVSNGNPKNQLMLFLHGFPECWYSWRHQLPEFSQKYFTVAVDMRGYGESDRPKDVSEYSLYKLVQDTKHIIESLIQPGQKCILVGHDWGGVIAQTTAAAHPELIDRMIVMNAPNSHKWMRAMQTDWVQFLMSWYIFYFNLPYIPEMTLKSFDFKTIEDLTKQYNTSEDIEVYKYYYSKTNGLTGPINYYRAYQRGIDYDFLREVNKIRITCPTLMLWGLNDHALTPDLANSSGKQCDNFTVKYIDDCSHWTQLNKPALVNQHMKMFLPDYV